MIGTANGSVNQQCSSSVDVAVQEFRLPRVAQALVHRHRSGIKVRLIVENTYDGPLESHRSRIGGVAFEGTRALCRTRSPALVTVVLSSYRRPACLYFYTLTITYCSRSLPPVFRTITDEPDVPLWRRRLLVRLPERAFAGVVDHAELNYAVVPTNSLAFSRVLVTGQGNINESLPCLRMSASATPHLWIQQRMTRIAWSTDSCLNRSLWLSLSTTPSSDRCNWPSKFVSEGLQHILLNRVHHRRILRGHIVQLLRIGQRSRRRLPMHHVAGDVAAGAPRAFEEPCWSTRITM